MLFKIIVIWTLSLCLFGETNVETEQKEEKQTDAFEHLEKTFLYGSYQEQLKALALYTPVNLKSDQRVSYLRLLKLLIGQEPESTPVYIKIIEIIQENKIQSHYDLFYQVLQKDFLKQDFLGNYKKKMVAKALQAIADLKLSKHAQIFSDFFFDKTLNNGETEVLRSAVYGMGVFKRTEDRHLLLDEYTNITQPRLQEEIVRSLSQFKNELDVDFFKSIIYSDEAHSFLKWIALVSLKEYTDSELAYNLLKSNLYNDDPEMRSRALYTISFFKKDEVKTMLIKSSKENNPKIRYQAVSGLEQYHGKEINDLLKYKMRRDSELSIRKKAREILEKRGFLKKDDKKK